MPTNKAVKELIDKYISEGVADACRIYLFGNSMGGRGVISLANAYPGFFTSVMSVAGSASGLSAQNVAQSPFYAVVGTADDVFSPADMQAFTEEVKAAGGITQFDELEGLTHEETLVKAYTVERIDWMFSQKKNDATEIESTIFTSGSSEVDAIYTTDGRRLNSLQKCPIPLYDWFKAV